MHNKIYITQSDADKIRGLLREAENTLYRGSQYIQQLKQEIDRAIIVQPRDITPDVITLNSSAMLLDIESGERMELTVVFPEHADVGRGKISVFAPVGAAMLGYKVGDVFEWETPDGNRKLRVEKIIEQPEASGDYS